MDPQTNPPQSPPPAPQTSAPGEHYNMPPVNPGQNIGIIGLIFSFVGLAPIGLILSIISTVKSSQASTSRSLGVVGIILNSIGIILLGFFFFVIVLASYSGIQNRANDSASQAYANSVSRQADAYFAENGSYPQTIADFSKYEASQLDSSISVTSLGPTSPTEIQYKACGVSGAKVAYLKSSSTVPTLIYLGTGSVKTC